MKSNFLAKLLFKLIKKYKVESKEEKKARLVAAAQDKKAGKNTQNSKPNLLKFGLNQITTLVEQKAAQLVVIASDVDPIELVCWLPALCRATETPFCIVKTQSSLGKFVGLKRTTAIAITSVDKADQHALDQLKELFKTKFNNELAFANKASKPTMGIKFQHKEAAIKKAKDAELLNKAA
jgi:large subunit ribosomal protein L7Ae